MRPALQAAASKLAAELHGHFIKPLDLFEIWSKRITGSQYFPWQ